MSFVSDPFVVRDLDQFKRFCDITAVKFDILRNGYDPNTVIVYSEDLVEPPAFYYFQGKEFELDFNAELCKMLAPGQHVVYRVEYEVGVHPNGEVEYWCDEMIGMPPQGDSNAKAEPDAGRVH